MFGEVSESISSRLRLRIVLFSIFCLGIAVAEVVEFLYTNKVDHGLEAAVWLALAAGWAYRFRHFGEPRVSKLDIDGKDKD
jgi:hypothetical protein